MSTRKHPYAVRKVTSGRNGSVSFIVVKNPGGRRVSVHAINTRQAAQAEADDLNIGAMVKPQDEDPRPYDVRHAEAEAAYRAEAHDYGSGYGYPDARLSAMSVVRRAS